MYIYIERERVSPGARTSVRLLPLHSNNDTDSNNNNSNSNTTYYNSK